MMYKQIIVAFLLLFSFQDLDAQLLEPFNEETLPSSWTRPLGVSFDEKGRGYVWEQGGKVFLLDENGDKISTPLIDISEEVSYFTDHGLLGFALHPNFYTNGHFYLLYVVDRHHLFNYGTPNYNADVTVTNEATIGRITRYTADASNDFKTTLLNSRKIILGKTPEEGFPILMGSHGVGSLLFGEDGTLLVTCGESASFESFDSGSAEETYFSQALDDGILTPEENIGAYRAQMLNSLNGKILRINPETGEGIPSNPFYDANEPNADRSKVWAMGMRNPFRVILKPNTGAHTPEVGQPGHLFVGDVGANWWEETSVVKSGGSNLGWPLYEALVPKWPFHWDDMPNLAASNPLYGNDCSQEFLFYSDLIKDPIQDSIFNLTNPCNVAIPIPEDIPTFIHNRPILAWSNRSWNQPPRSATPSFNADGLASAITLDSLDSTVDGQNFDGYSSLPGFFYEGENVPDELRGKYFQADYAGWIRMIDLDENYNVLSEQTLHDSCKDIVSLSYNPLNGDIYYTNVVTQKLVRITYGGTPPPVAVASADTYYGVSPLTVQFEGENSFSPYQSPLTYHWDFGDGTTSTETNPQHVFSAANDAPQSFDVTLTVTDTVDIARQHQLVISLNNTPPTVQISSFENGDFYPTGGLTNLPLKATVTDAEHELEDLTFEWITYLHHNEHFHPEPLDNNPETFTLIEPVGCDQETFWYRVELVVTDANGLSASDTNEIFPYCGDDFIEVINLVGVANQQSIELNWATSFEEEVTHFEIQRSPNISDFQSIGTTDSNTNADYQFIDINPIRGTNTYRIKAINSDGVYVYSNETQVLFPAPLPFRIYPNPASDFVKIEVLKPQSNTITFEFFDAIGKRVILQEWSTISVDKKVVKVLPTNHLAAGVYYYRLTNSEQIETGRILISRDQ